jgi:hypothetical protein
MSGNINFDGWINDDGSENYKCRAWVNFNGTGTVAIRASGNVSSITDNGTGLYTVNFTTAMPDANYSFVVGGNISNGTSHPALVTGRNTQSTTSLPVTTSYDTSAGTIDLVEVCIAVFR